MIGMIDFDFSGFILISMSKNFVDKSEKKYFQFYTFMINIVK